MGILFIAPTELAERLSRCTKKASRRNWRDAPILFLDSAAVLIIWRKNWRKMAYGRYLDLSLYTPSTPVKSSLSVLLLLILLAHGLHGGESTQSSNASSHKLSQPSIFKGFRISGRMYLLAGFCIFTVNWCKKWCKFRCRTQVTAMDIFPSRRAKLSIFFSFVASL